ncbi:MAG TPA: polysaccharide biosynthesis protein [Bacillales bacterium]
MTQSRLIRGTFILSAAIYFSKFLGLIFFIPLNALVGDKGMALYLYAYTPYMIMISMATLGVPRAVSKFVSKYNARGDYETGRRLFRSGLLFMTITGFAAFVLLYFLAPEIAPFVVKSHSSTGNDPEDVVMVIRLVSVALILVPAMSLIRGYFQGFQSMGPTAVSQVVEQIIRILFALVGAVFIVFMFGESHISTAVGFAAFAPFVGALGGFAVLIRFWMKRKSHLDRQLAQSRVHTRLPLKGIYKELITFAIPFVAVGLAIPLYRLVDQFTINQILMSQGLDQLEAERIYANISGLAQKLIVIPVAFSTALSTTLVPAITSSFSSGKYRMMNNQMTQAFQIVLFLTIPAAVGLSLLAYPIYGALYGIEGIKLGGEILQWYAPTALLFALFGITSSVLQGINRQKVVVFSLLVGLLLKLLLNSWLLTIFHEIGAILATDIGYICSITLNVIIIGYYTQYKFTFIAKRTVLILLFSAVMGIMVWLVTLPFKVGHPLPENWSWLWALIIMIVGVAVGAACYFWLALRSNLAKQVLGNRFSFAKRRKAKS